MRYLYILPLFLVLIIVFLFWQENKDSLLYIPMESSSSFVSSSSVVSNQVSFTINDVHRLLLLRTKQKKGVYLEKIPPSLDTLALDIVAVFHEVMGDDYTPVITSANDYPYHARFSKHYYNKAIDFRTNNMNSNQKKELYEKAQKKINKRGRVFLEFMGKPNEHLHLELLD